jgi:hypothetical protein
MATPVAPAAKAYKFNCRETGAPKVEIFLEDCKGERLIESFHSRAGEVQGVRGARIDPANYVAARLKGQARSCKSFEGARLQPLKLDNNLKRINRE